MFGAGIEPVNFPEDRFDDGHDGGLYSWDYLYNLGKARMLWREV